MSRIVIGCAVEDRSLAEQLAERLPEKARGACGDELKSEEWSPKNCRIFVLLFSESANRSEELLESLQRAVAAGAVVLPLKLSKETPSDGYAYFLNSIHWLDSTREGRAKAEDLLVERCRAILEADAPKPRGRRGLCILLGFGAALLCGIIAVALVQRSHPSAPPAVGDRIRFGHYSPNGGESQPLEWIIADIDEESGAYTLLCAYCVEALPYHEADRSITWENCSLRAWLNDAFYSAAFTDDERQKILETELDNGSLANAFATPNGVGYSVIYQTDNENDTIDRVFLLSNHELEAYFPNAEDRIAALEGSDEAVTWWVRAAARAQDTAITVLPDGSRSYATVDAQDVCVRPALRMRSNP